MTPKIRNAARVPKHVFYSEQLILVHTAPETHRSLKIIDLFGGDAFLILLTAIGRIYGHVVIYVYKTIYDMFFNTSVFRGPTRPQH